MLNSANALFYKYSDIRNPNDIENLWAFFDIAIQYADNPNPGNRDSFIHAFNTCQQQKGVKWNLTTGLYWIRPFSYACLSSTVRRHIEESGLFSNETSKLITDCKSISPTAETYLAILDALNNELRARKHPYKDFIGLTHFAYNNQPIEYLKNVTMERRKLSIIDGKYVVDIDISIEEWKDMLQRDAIFYPEALNMVLQWYKQPGHQAVTSLTHPNYKGTPYNSIVVALGKRIITHLNRFEIEQESGMGNSYWCIPFEGWYGANGQFIWKVRDELVIAIEELGLADGAETDCIVAEEVEEVYEAYSTEQFLEEVYISPQDYEDLKGKLLHKKNIILQGAPGVGKTFSAKRLAWSIMGCKDESRVKMVQFHQSYGYEDFIMGYRPCCDGGFELKCGPFYDFCKQAARDINRDYFFIIDEINRGNLSKIFGELFMLMENEHRGEFLTLLYNGESFTIPGNVHIIGMMNTADRSLAMLDYALRRRFAFFELHPAFLSAGFIRYQQQHSHAKFNNLIATVIRLNEEIEHDDSLGRGFRIGHSYFCSSKELTDSWLKSVVNYEIIPLLEEYWFDSPEKVENWKQSLQGCIQ